MSDPLEGLSRALADRYIIDREIGRGATATVYLAQDRKHARPVAIKVLAPELILPVRTERFLREIQIAARLQHPHILPLHDSGRADGLLYYVMPYVAGETLRERIAREGPLPLHEALRITREVASALSYAHQQGVVHRDIKPGNILLSAGQAVVADFGIARAISVAETQIVTETGRNPGTPAYMSPEQAEGEARIDGRTDIYSLGCVLYEMLVGAPPFVGPSAQSLVAQHLVNRPPSLRRSRTDVPEEIERLVTRALAKNPDERFQTAGELADALPVLAGVRVPKGARWSRPRVAVPVAVLTLIAAGVGAGLLLRERQSGLQAIATEDNLVAILPFRVTGNESALGFLREGMLDLLSARLTGDFGPRALDPRALLSRWRRAAQSSEGDLSEEAVFALAHGFGADRILSGGIVSSPRGFVIQAALLPVPPSRRPPAFATVEGQLDGITRLVDELVAQLLVHEAGESSQRLATLTSTSLPALRAYLDGQVNYRRGSYEAAVGSFRSALAIDSTFALAGLGLRNAAVWSSYSADAATQGLALAWRYRARLGPRDLAFLTAVVGPHYPAPSSYAEYLDAWERVVTEMPDRTEAWFEVGDLYVHFGPLLDLDAGMDRSAAAFDRSLELDSAFQAPLEHLFEIAALTNDTTRVRQLLALLVARAADHDATIARWQAALALGNTEALRTARNGLDSLSLEDELLVAFYAQIAAVWGENGGLDDADHAVDQLLRRSTTRGERAIAADAQHTLALNRGRPGAALRIGQMLDDRVRVLDALYWEGDTLAGAMSARRLMRRAAHRDAQLADLCALEQWRLSHGDRTTAAKAIARLRVASNAETSAAMSSPTLCAALLEALRAVGEKHGDARYRVDYLDSLLRTGPPVSDLFEAGLVLARLREEQGDPAGALVATRRRALALGGVQYLSSYLREQGRLAALTGHRDEAIRAYRHYLILRSAPEPALVREVARVRKELATLLAERSTTPE